MEEETKEIEENEFINEIILKSSNYDTLVISGGAVKTFILLGALQYACDNYLLNEIDKYYATSGGSMISYLLIIGYTPIEIIIYICTHQVLEKMNNMNLMSVFDGNGVMSFLYIHEFLEKMTIEKIGFIPTFKDLKDKYNKELTCVTYNLTEEKTEYISYKNYPSLPCLIGIRMSSSLPFFFDKFKYGNNYYIDGGVTDNFAIEEGLRNGRKILGIHNKSSYDYDEYDTSSQLHVIYYFHKIMSIPIQENLKNKLDKVLTKTNVDYIPLVEKNTSMFNFSIDTKTKLDLFSFGYQEMKNYFEK